MRTMVLGGAVLAFVAGGCTDSDVVRDVDTASQVASSRSMPQRDEDRVLQQPYDKILSQSGVSMKPDPGGSFIHIGRGDIGTVN